MEWMPDEIAKLKELYPSATKKEVIEKLPGRTWKAIHAKAKRLKIRSSGVRYAKSPEWRQAISEAMKGEKNHQWKGDDCILRTAYGRAERLYGSECPLGHEIHHKDENPWNNERDNIVFRSRRDHMIEDGRMNRRDAKGRFISG